MEPVDQRARPTPTSWPRSAASTRPRSQAPPPGSAQRLDGKHCPAAGPGWQAWRCQERWWAGRPTAPASTAPAS